MNVPFTTEVSVKQKEMSVLIGNLLQQDEIYWSQRGRVNWLRHGDRNTKYFSHFASARRKNLIKKLRVNESGWIEGNDNLKPLISDYFKNLF